MQQGGGDGFDPFSRYIVLCDKESFLVSMEQQ